MKILFLTRSLNLGGAERQMVELAKGLHRRGHVVNVAALYSVGPLREELLAVGVPVHVLGKKGRWDVFGFFGRMIAHIRSTDPDVLHGYHVVPNLLTVLCKPFMHDTKIVWGVRSSDMDLSRYDWFARVTFNLSCVCARFADRIIVNSTKGLEYHRSCGYPGERMVVVFNGIDTDKYHPAPLAREQVREEWGIKPGVKLIGMIARLDPMKDHETFLMAAKILVKQRPDVHFVCVGGGSGGYQESIIRLCDEMGLNDQVTWAGERRDMPAVYNALDVLTSCSITEGFSNVVAEAMSCGIPCVVTDVGDSATIVAGTGTVVPARSPQSLAAGWLQCLDRYNQLPEALIRQRIITEFSLEALLDNTERTIQTMHEGLAAC